LRRVAATVGGSKSSTSAEVIEVSAPTLCQLAERPGDDLEILIVYVEGLVFGKVPGAGVSGVDTMSLKEA
jgi:hypothetical protein